MAPTAVRVEQIAGISDPILRNLRITQCYQELSVAIRARIGGGANWCTFATWASRQAGQTIRGEDLEDLLRAHIERSTRTPLVMRDILLLLSGDRSMLMRQIRDTVRELGPLRRSSLQVALGNQKVFAEIGLLFARFLESFDDKTRFTEFLEDMVPGEPPDGQDLLARAFGIYRSLTSLTGKARTERLLLANLLVGLHEQTRLQPQIRGALDESIVRVEDIDEVLASKLAAGRGSVARILDSLFPSRLAPLRILTRPLAEELREIIRAVITDQMMTLALPPDRVLRLGRDVPGRFPADLVSISDAHLSQVLFDIDPTANSLAASGAVEWSDFNERMHFIADLFRAFHEDAALFHAPFDAEQVARIEAGEVPASGI